MTLTDKEVYEDYKRFLRHEAMRANCKQSDILKIINDGEISNS
jgi:hypothetical protein